MRRLRTERNGVDPRTQRAVATLRRLLSTELELPMKAAALDSLKRPGARGRRFRHVSQARRHWATHFDVSLAPSHRLLP